jgi:hypothetical protein
MFTGSSVPIRFRDYARGRVAMGATGTLTVVLRWLSLPTDFVSNNWSEPQSRAFSNNNGLSIRFSAGQCPKYSLTGRTSRSVQRLNRYG